MDFFADLVFELFQFPLLHFFDICESMSVSVSVARSGIALTPRSCVCAELLLSLCGATSRNFFRVGALLLLSTGALRRVIVCIYAGKTSLIVRHADDTGVWQGGRSVCYSKFGHASGVLVMFCGAVDVYLFHCFFLLVCAAWKLTGAFVLLHALRYVARVQVLREVALQLVLALNSFKACDMIHADIKPDNIMFTHLPPPAVPPPPSTAPRLGQAGQDDHAEHDLGDQTIKDESSVASSLLGRLRVVDLGNAIPLSNVGLYAADFKLQTLAYRAPEVVFGAPFGCVSSESVGKLFALEPTSSPPRMLS